eukprot:CAMPEP_0172530842 /NCGR_PEP_ID=MMETSP1067-20121228/4464_1 /TAXON_ID=265564 ORGANISM="Thalassiosira punctigera, Strain Tpunct2005C2" /NCGR_SAMPLE_ID=MMETSP1067 /ASSEMBLY_ACC=CAM_ASM_000444 /LENGTH=133 /DNA_ID=CAMNT_0013315135 /DNA_START=20 /DNA_END=421 /DNA_ORIENTATION=-
MTMHGTTKALLLLLSFLPLAQAFAPHRNNHLSNNVRQTHGHEPIVSLAGATTTPSCLHMIDKKRRDQLGLSDDDDEYDLGVALSTNTDDGISKIVAGSFILVMIALLVVGLVIPSITDYGEGVCSPIQNGGRC